MSFQHRLLVLFALTVFLSVAAVTAIVSSVTRQAFKRSDDERSAVLVAQFRREFSRRGDEVVRKVDAIASSEAVTRMGLALNHESPDAPQDQGAPDYGAFLNMAKNIAIDQQLDFLEFVDKDGIILSSAQFPAKFGYKDSAFTGVASKGAFLRQELLPDGPELGLSAIREVHVGDRTIYAVGGRHLDKDFLSGLDVPAGSRAMLYENLGGAAGQLLAGSSGPFEHPELLLPLVQQVQQVQQSRREANALVHWTTDDLDDESVHAIPLSSQDNQLLGILLVGNSRRSYVGLQRHFRSAALLAASVGILLATLFSSWISRRVTQPVKQLAEAARSVAQGDWGTRVPVTSGDELGQLADAFNRMTTELIQQRERLVQSERVAAWRELARRLAHELKNPLFPLQLTVENLVRARQHGPEQFEEVFQESSTTLLAEIANLKAIISRFSDFSRMPQPTFQRTDLNEIVRNVAQLFQAQMQLLDSAPIVCHLELMEPAAIAAADPELLHRTLSNLVLNALDAMPQGGTLTLRTRAYDDTIAVEVSDSGTGLTSEEREHLFTPYYTSKIHGTGLGLAIVQSVVSDHGGTISVRSDPGRGTTFMIELPRHLDRLPINNPNSPGSRKE